MDESILGAWKLCADGRCHHFLRGAALCGSRARATGPVPIKMDRRPGRRLTRTEPVVSAYCPACKARNAERWTDPGGLAGVA